MCLGFSFQNLLRAIGAKKLNDIVVDQTFEAFPRRNTEETQNEPFLTNLVLSEMGWGGTRDKPSLCLFLFINTIVGPVGFKVNSF